MNCSGRLWSRTTKQRRRESACEWDEDVYSGSEANMKQRLVVVVVIARLRLARKLKMMRSREAQRDREGERERETCPNLSDNRCTADVNVVINTDFSLHAVAQEFAHNRRILYGLIGKAQDYTQLDWKTFKIKAVVPHSVSNRKTVRYAHVAFAQFRFQDKWLPIRFTVSVCTMPTTASKEAKKNLSMVPAKRGTGTNFAFVWHQLTSWRILWLMPLHRIDTFTFELRCNRQICCLVIVDIVRRGMIWNNEVSILPVFF